MSGESLISLEDIAPSSTLAEATQVALALIHHGLQKNDARQLVVDVVMDAWINDRVPEFSASILPTEQRLRTDIDEQARLAG